MGLTDDRVHITAEQRIAGQGAQVQQCDDGLFNPEHFFGPKHNFGSPSVLFLK